MVSMVVFFGIINFRILFCALDYYVALGLVTSSLRSRVIAHTHTHSFNGPLSGTTQVIRYQKGKTSRDFTEARDSECQWHQLGYMQVCTALQTDSYTSTPPLKFFLHAGCPSCRPTNIVKALKGYCIHLKLLSNKKN